jgi:mRNA interferase HigB
MRVIAVATLRVFWAEYPDSEQPLKAWFDEARNAVWESPADIKRHYRSASILRDNRVVFNISGNKYRLIVAVLYPAQMVLIKFIGTHEQYDKIDAQTVSQKRRLK